VPYNKKAAECKGVIMGLTLVSRGRNGKGSLKNIGKSRKRRIVQAIKRGNREKRRNVEKKEKTKGGTTNINKK